jgi:hypothetical protein
VHPFQETPIGKDPWDKRDHIDKVGGDASYTHFPGPGFSEKEGEVPEKVFVRVHGMYLFKKRALVRGPKRDARKRTIGSHIGTMILHSFR